MPENNILVGNPTLSCHLCDIIEYEGRLSGIRCFSEETLLRAVDEKKQTS